MAVGMGASGLQNPRVGRMPSAKKSAPWPGKNRTKGSLCAAHSYGWINVLISHLVVVKALSPGPAFEQVLGEL